MSSYEGSGMDYTDYSEYSSSDDYSDTESYCSAQGGYKVPVCDGCKRYKKRWISRTRKNPMRPFLTCPNRNFRRQCDDSFEWEDVYLAKCRNRSSEESSYVCDECLEKEREIGEIGSAKVDDKASLDRVKLEPLKWSESPESEYHIKKRIKDENVADNISLFGKVKDESLGKYGDESGIPLFGKVKDEPLDIDGDESVISLFGKAKHEPLDTNGDGSGMLPRFGKVKDEPSDQNRNDNGYVVNSVCKRCGKQKRKIDEIGSARDDKKERELLTKLETGHEISAEPSLNPNPKRKRYNGVDNLGIGSKVMESDRMNIPQMGLNVGGNNSSDNQRAFIKQENHEGFETPSLQLAPQVGYATRPDHPVVNVFAMQKKGGCSTSQENANFVMEYEFFPGCSKNKEDELKLKNADENYDGTCLEVAAGTSSIDLSLKLS